MKGVFVKGKDIKNMLDILTYKGNLLSKEERLERLQCMWSLDLITTEMYYSCRRQIVYMFKEQPLGDMSFEEILA